MRKCTSWGECVYVHGGAEQQRTQRYNIHINIFHEGRLCIRGFLYITSVNPHSRSLKDMLVFTNSKDEEPRFKEISYCIHGHTSSKWQNQDPNPSLLNSKVHILSC